MVNQLKMNLSVGETALPLHINKRNDIIDINLIFPGNISPRNIGVCKYNNTKLISGWKIGVCNKHNLMDVVGCFVCKQGEQTYIHVGNPCILTIITQ